VFCVHNTKFNERLEAWAENNPEINMLPSSSRLAGMRNCITHARLP
jgi:hypothetical protein